MTSADIAEKTKLEMRAATILMLTLLCAPQSAWAQEDADETNYIPKTERRDGFSVGLGYGLGLGNYVGYPNEVEAINNPEYRSSTGTSLASGLSVWLGGALRDWLTVGVGMTTQGGSNGDLLAGGAAFGMHLEGFPLFGLGELWRDLGIIAEFGAGSALIEDGDGNETANGGSMSMVGFGLLYEPWQFWRMSTGPTLMYKYQFSDSMTASTVLLGWRLAFYWTQPG